MSIGSTLLVLKQKTEQAGVTIRCGIKPQFLILCFSIVALFFEELFEPLSNRSVVLVSIFLFIMCLSGCQSMSTMSLFSLLQIVPLWVRPGVL